MGEHERCVFCNEMISNENMPFYKDQKEIYYRKTSYQILVDLLIDLGNYDKISFDHDKSMGDSYRNKAIRKRSVLQKENIKGRKYHLKWPDISCVKGNEVKLLIELENTVDREKAKKDLSIIKDCNYLYLDDSFYEINDTVLIVVFEEAPRFKPELFNEKIGNLKNFIICDFNDFETVFKYCFLEGDYIEATSIDDPEYELSTGIRSSIGYESSHTSEEIEDIFKPVTKDIIWYRHFCMGEENIPEKSINGRTGGRWVFFTKDGKIMRTGESTKDRLNLKTLH